MPFSEEVKRKAFIACGRKCCICHKFCGNNMEVHHIKPESEGGENTFENAIPLCFDCHAEVGQYNPNHPKGNKFTQEELKGHRDSWYRKNAQATTDSDPLTMKVSVNRVNDYQKQMLVRITTGKELFSFIGQACAWTYDYDEPKTWEETELISDFIQLMGECVDEMDVMEPMDQVRFGFLLNEKLAQIEEKGFYVFCANEKSTLKVGDNSSESFPLFHVRIVRKDSEEIIKLKVNKDGSEVEQCE